MTLSQREDDDIKIKNIDNFPYGTVRARFDNPDRFDQFQNGPDPFGQHFPNFPIIQTDLT